MADPLVSLRPGVDAGVVLNALESLLHKLGPARQSGNKFDVFNAYLRWANEAAAQLTPLLAARDVDRLVLTRRHWVLQRIDPSANDALLGLVHLEMDERHREITGARDALYRQHAIWTEKAGPVVVADTNVYLHHPKSFAQIPWRELARACARDYVHVAVPLLVVDELDNAKERKGTARTRARTTLRALRRMFGDPDWVVPLQEGGSDDRIRVHIVMDPVHHERLDDSDTELVDRARALADLTGQRVIVVTYDSGMAFRAKAAGLTVEMLEHADDAKE